DLLPRRRAERRNGQPRAQRGARAHRGRDPSGRSGLGPTHLAGAELPVAGVAEAGDDVALLVEALVERADVDRDVRVRAGEGSYPVGRGGDPDILRARVAP